MISGFRTVLYSLREARARRAAIRALSALNEHQLADIGVERGFIIDAVIGDARVFGRHRSAAQ